MDSVAVRRKDLPVKRTRNVKIIATVGPASTSQEMIEKLFLAGVDVFRINMSHSSHDSLKERHDIIRQLETEHDRPIGILVDLQGPKLRIGTFKKDEITIRATDTFILDDNPDPGDNTRVHLPHPEIFNAIKPGHHLLLNDGRVRVEVTAVDSSRIETRVIFGGELSARKGVNLPDTVVPLAALTDKDRADLEYACDLGIDWIAMSFVQRPEDVAEGRKLVRGRAGVMAKMEKPAALNELDAIITPRRWHHGRSRRSRRRTALGSRTRLAEDPDKSRPARRQAGRRRHTDARIDDRGAGADPRRGLRCRQCRL